MKLVTYCKNEGDARLGVIQNQYIITKIVNNTSIHIKNYVRKSTNKYHSVSFSSHTSSNFLRIKVVFLGVVNIRPVGFITKKQL